MCVCVCTMYRDKMWVIPRGSYILFSGKKNNNKERQIRCICEHIVPPDLLFDGTHWPKICYILPLPSPHDHFEGRTEKPRQIQYTFRLCRSYFIHVYAYRINVPSKHGDLRGIYFTAINVHNSLCWPIYIYIYVWLGIGPGRLRVL